MNGLYRRAPLVLMLGLSAFSTLYAYVALAEGEPLGRGPILCLGMLCAAFAVIEYASGGLEFMPRELGREIVGFAILVCTFISLVLLAQLNVLGRGFRWWEIVVACTCGFAFFLHSQRSFLMTASLQSFLMLWALLFVPSAAAATVFAAGVIALCALVFHRERVEETSTTSRPIDPRTPLKPLPFCLAGFVGLMAFFCVLQPAESISYSELVGRGKPAKAGSLLVGSVLDQMLPTEAMPDPFARWTVPGMPRAPGEAPPEQTGLAFQRDLKFGDLPSGGGHPETVVMYVRLLDGRGEAMQGDGLPLFWKTGTVYRYEHGEWSGDPTPGRLVDDGEDGTRDGHVRLRPEAARCATEAFEQRVILWPQPTRSLFALYPVESINLTQVYVDSDGTLARTGRYEGRFKYSVRGRLPVPTDVDLRGARIANAGVKYLGLPQAVERDVVLGELVREVEAEGRTPHDRALAAQGRLERFAYTLRPKLAEGQDPTLAFLRSRRGYCQHFASALCAALRRMGIPSRIAVGFARGDWDRDREVFTVRRKHAHAWVEVCYDGIGWVPYDPALAPTQRWMTEGEPKEPEPAEVPPDPPPPDPPSTAPPPNTATPPVPPRTVEPPRTATPPPQPPDPPRTATPTPNPPRPPSPPVNPPAERDREFDELWGAIENKFTGGPVPSPGGANTGPGETPPPGGGKGESPLEEGAGQSAIGKAASAAAGLVWRILRDLLIILCGAAVLVAIAVAVLRIRRARAEHRRGTGQVAEERYLDEEAPAEEPARRPAGRMTHRRRIVEIYGEFLARLARIGLARHPSQTAVEFASYLGEQLAPVPGGVHRLTGLFTRARYAEGDLTSEDVGGAESAMRESTAEAKRARKR